VHKILLNPLCKFCIQIETQKCTIVLIVMENIDNTDSTVVENKETIKSPDTKETADEYPKWVRTALYLLMQQDLERKESKGKVSKHKVEAQLKYC
jgi:uncharacterized lipoprotein NlpE involved in copper resistance